MTKQMKWDKQEGTGLGFWKPEEKGEELVGTVSHIEEGEFGTNYTVTDEAGEEHITPAHTVLLDRMQEVVEGDTVRIVYLGMGVAKKGRNPANLYEVFIGREVDEDEIVEEEPKEEKAKEEKSTKKKGED